MKALFRPQAKSAIGNDVDLGSNYAIIADATTHRI